MTAAPQLTAAPAPRIAPTAPAPAADRPGLALVQPRRVDAPRAPFVAVVMAILVAGLLGLLTLNTVLAQDAFHLHTLKSEGRALEEREQELLREVERLRSPEHLSSRATELGMVPAGPPAFLELPSGRVLGEPTPAEDLDLPEGAVAAVPPIELPSATADGATGSDSESDEDTGAGTDGEDAP